MKPKKRQKLCYNCEGEVDLDVIFCPFCGADLMEEKEVEMVQEENDEDVRSMSSKESITSLYPPLYQPENEDESPSPGSPEPEKEADKPKKETFFSLFFLTLGAWLFLLGILLFIFSENGEVLLRLNAKSWLIYLLFSFPLLFFGAKFLSRFESN